MDGQDWVFWTFAVSTLIAVVAGLLATRVRGEWLARLPLAHVAGATCIALFGWEMLVYLPGTVLNYSAMVSGIPHPPGVADRQLFVVASAVFPAAAAIAVVGILRRRPWAIVLGIGVAATRLATSVAGIGNTLSFAESFPPEEFGPMVVSLIAQNTVPALAAIGLLLWPLWRGSTAEAPPVASVDWHADPSAEVSR